MKEYMKKILEELHSRNESRQNLPFRDDLISLLKILSPEEKTFLTDKFMKLNWDVGSLNVLHILQKSNLLSITEYIARISNEDNHIESIMCDLFESNYELLGSILIDSFYYVKKSPIETSLNDSITLLISHFQRNPNVINENYLIEVKRFVNEDVYHKFKFSHLDIILHSHSISALNALNEIDKWKVSIDSIEGSVFYHILKEVIKDIDLIKKLLNNSIHSEFKGWKYFVILLYMSSKLHNKSQDFSLVTKEHLKHLFKDYVKTNSQTLFFGLFISARALFPIKNDPMETICPYSVWFKNTFSDVKYVITTPEFKQIIVRLNELVQVEKVTTYLETQTKIGINAPAFCNDLVLEYKSNCRMKIASLKENLNRPNQNMIIDID